MMTVENEASSVPIGTRRVENIERLLTLHDLHNAKNEIIEEFDTVNRRLRFTY